MPPSSAPQRLSGELDAVWRMQSLREAPSKRDLWKRKVDQVAEEADALRVGLDRFTHRQQHRHLEEQHRQELFERRAGGGGGVLLDAEAEAKAARHVHRSKQARGGGVEGGQGGGPCICYAAGTWQHCRQRGARHLCPAPSPAPPHTQVLEEAYETGVGIIGAMGGQRERLKATHRKVLDVLNRVGLSDSVLRLAERRQRLDKLLVYGGMIAVLLLVVGLYWWRHGGK